jgi:hypothetical protein
LVLANGAVSQTRSKKSQPSGTTQSANKGRWYSLTSPDRDFLIEFPVKPERLGDIEGPSGTGRIFMLVAGATAFRLSFTDTGIEPSSHEGNQLPLDFRREMLEHARERGWTVLSSELLRSNVYEQETWSPMKNNPSRSLHHIERSIFRYGRMYALTCSSIIPDLKVDAGVCRRFFGSFRVIRAPQPQ